MVSLKRFTGEYTAELSPTIAGGYTGLNREIPRHIIESLEEPFQWPYDEIFPMPLPNPVIGMDPRNTEDRHQVETFQQRHNLQAVDVPFPWPSENLFPIRNAEPAFGVDGRNAEVRLEIETFQQEADGATNETNETEPPAHYQVDESIQWHSLSAAEVTSASVNSDQDRRSE